VRTSSATTSDLASSTVATRCDAASATCRSSRFATLAVVPETKSHAMAFARVAYLPPPADLRRFAVVRSPWQTAHQEQRERPLSSVLPFGRPPAARRRSRIANTTSTQHQIDVPAATAATPILKRRAK
jgi:hypothetical protein